jgi:hypothetical protein
MRRHTARAAFAAAGSCIAAAAARGDIAFNNFGPGDAYSGNGWIIWGPQSSSSWTQGFRFVSQASGGITNLVVPMQDYTSGGPGTYVFELYTDTPAGPGTVIGTIGETAGFVNMSPPLPPPVQIGANGSVLLSSGAAYWLVARALGSSQGGWHSNDLGQMGQRAYLAHGNPQWTLGTVEMSAFRIEVGGQSCYPNCDGSTAAPVLNVADFTCFLQGFAVADPYANCDGSTALPVLNVADFTCFLQKFAAGCP